MKRYHIKPSKKRELKKPRKKKKIKKRNATTTKSFNLMVEPLNLLCGLVTSTLTDVF